VNTGRVLVAAARVVVIVAFGAGSRHQVDRVTVAASSVSVPDTATAFSTIRRFRMREVEFRRRPFCRIMASRTNLALEQTLMESRVSMAAGAFLGCAFEYVIDVAFFAEYASVRAIQFKS
jgi:hypothetical protein